MRALVIGGNRFFGKHLVKELLCSDISVTILNRGNLADGFGDQVTRLFADRRHDIKLEKAIGTNEWDIVFDQVCFTASEAEAVRGHFVRVRI